MIRYFYYIIFILKWISILYIPLAHVNKQPIWPFIFLFLLLSFIHYRIKAKKLEYYVDWLKQGAKRDSPLKEKFDSKLKNLASYTTKMVSTYDKKHLQRDKYLQLLFDGISALPNGVIILNSQLQILMINPLAAQLFSLDQTRDIKQYINNLIREPKFIQYLEKKKFSKALKLTTLSQKKLTIHFNKDQAGNYILMINDYTEEALAEKLKRNFVADVSHELRTPLTVLAGFIETQKTLPLSQEQLKHHLDLMQAQTDRMLHLIEHLLTLAKLENSPLPAEDTWFELSPLVEQLKVSSQQLSSGRHEIVFNPLENIQIAGNKAEIQSAFINILVNAIHYTPAKGKIEVLFLINQEQELIYQVKDNGEGISAENIDRLSDRFFRVDKSRSQETGGTGLGLSIVQNAINRHDGKLIIESQLGKGSTFSLVFPAKRIKRLDPKDSMEDEKTNLNSSGTE